MNGIEKAIKVCGGPAALAKRIGVTRQVINYWRNVGYVPPAQARDVHEETEIPLYELNPMIFVKGKA